MKREQVALFPSQEAIGDFPCKQRSFLQKPLVCPLLLVPQEGLAIQLVTQKAVVTIYLSPTEMKVPLEAQLSAGICKP